ncbi:ATP phosphoribosyltransferase regulatory subunit [Acidithiobacillus sp. HP-6]|uniref:ATP phosphoribosyltransferase regulatory subunit n=1 Tax=unclassified Acidithiobacillus TaxID=2614800 RepID=UPI001879934F|nr:MULTISPECIES: ATP phosphoribosyltransferase regulatory subunit [unclassified Acidithiobacillus]MBE7563058.1 ATP phosphoribosyltransferase regulatory subunit [Acidithiobacillus sp. HP-6]MBE7568887.1 ATP phosphoribosyltransferase regulatory subunit [Acidithiobacillus sp. HP-2]
MRSENHPTWLLPSGFEDVLPARTDALEHCRRSLLDRYALWGYRQVTPPLVEHLESLLTGSGADLDLQTWKLLDQDSGRLVGLRSDMTPQMARIDAQTSASGEIRRLAYAGTVLRARPDLLGGSRAPFQVGAELFGVAGPEGDLEVLSLMVESLRHCQVPNLLLDIGHVSIPRALADAAGLATTQRNDLLRHVERKAWPDVRHWLQIHGAGQSLCADFDALARLQGDHDVLSRARQQLGHHPAICKALDDLHFVWEALHLRYPDLDIQCDLSEIRGHLYHTGLLFSLFGPQRGEALARGGRYDDIGAAFGRRRPATGFSLDLKPLLRDLPESRRNQRIWAPAGSDQALWKAIAEQRQQGHVVAQDFLAGELPDEVQLKNRGFDALLEHSSAGWVLRSLNAR